MPRVGCASAAAASATGSGLRRPAAQRVAAAAAGAGAGRLRPEPGLPPAGAATGVRPGGAAGSAGAYPRWRPAARAGRAAPPGRARRRRRPGSSTRAQISSSCRRGAVAPRISVRPALTMSAARDSSAAPKWAACWRIRSSSSAGCSPRIAAGRVGHGVEDDQVAQPLEQVLGEPARVVAGLDDPVDDAEHRGRVTGRERLDGVVEQAGVGVAEQRSGARRRSAPRCRRPAISWSRTLSESRTEPRPARTTSESTAGRPRRPPARRSRRR